MKINQEVPLNDDIARNSYGFEKFEVPNVIPRDFSLLKQILGIFGQESIFRKAIVKAEISTISKKD